jgi:hypothetical protein
MGLQLDVETTPLCQTTPMGAALDTANAYLGQIKKAGRSQFLLMITDGTDYDVSCPSPTYPDPIARLDALANAGIKTFLVGFSADQSASGVDPVKMNKLACAAQSAKNFATSCKKGPSGYYEPVDGTANAPHLYLEASDRASLDAALGGVAASLGCQTCLR